MRRYASKFTLTAGRLAVLGLCSYTTAVFAQSTPAVQELGDVVVSASGISTALKDAPASITVLSSEELRQRAFTNIGEALYDVPGVDIRQGGGKVGAPKISIRGMPSDYTLILIDGKRQNTSGSVAPNGFSEMQNAFLPPASQIERIEVIRGPMSTLHGSDAMGGVINIITKPTSQQEWSGQVDVGSIIHLEDGGGNVRQVGASIAGALVPNVLGLRLHGKYMDRSQAERFLPGTGRDPRPSEGDVYDFGGKLTWNVNDRHELYLDLGRSRTYLKNTDNVLGTLDRPGNFRGYKDYLAMERDRFNIGHVYYGDRFDLETYYSHVVTETDGRTIPGRGRAPTTSFYPFWGGEDRTLKNTDQIFHTRLRTQLGNHGLTLGAEYARYKTEDLIAGPGVQFKNYQWALYAEDQWRVFDPLVITLGARYEHHEVFDGHFTPRAYAVYNITDRLTLKGGVSAGYKTPTSNQLHDGIYSVGGQGRNFNFGSPHLEPEKSTNYEIGLAYNDGRTSLSATYFYNNIRDLITRGQPIDCVTTPGHRYCGIIRQINAGVTELSQSYNAEKAKTQGIELAASHWLTDKWFVKASYTWTDTEVRHGDGAGEDYNTAQKPHAVNLHTAYDISDNWRVWFEAEYRSDRDRFSGDLSKLSSANKQVLDAVGHNDIKGYTVFNLGTRFEPTKNLSVTAVVNNLFDKKFDKWSVYQDSRGRDRTVWHYGGSSSSGALIERRNLWVNLSYKF